jgi:hypothetical protein
MISRTITALSHKQALLLVSHNRLGYPGAFYGDLYIKWMDRSP